jgi:protein-S-isoprenylcysteine O-methyltransferase Ste14
MVDVCDRGIMTIRNEVTPVAGTDKTEWAWIGRVQKLRKVVLWLVIVSALAVQVVIAASIQPSSPFHEFVEWFGVALMLVCVFGRTWSSLYIGGRKGAEIVREGPYALSRNPLYLFSIIGAAGAAAQSGSVTLMVLSAALTWLVFRLVVVREEEFLLARHGAVYQAYLADVPRFFPRLFAFPNVAERSVAPHIVMRTVLDSMVFFVAIPVFELIEWLQGAHVLPVYLVLP